MKDRFWPWLAAFGGVAVLAGLLYVAAPTPVSKTLATVEPPSYTPPITPAPTPGPWTSVDALVALLMDAEPGSAQEVAVIRCGREAGIRAGIEVTEEAADAALRCAWSSITRLQ